MAYSVDRILSIGQTQTRGNCQKVVWVNRADHLSFQVAQFKEYYQFKPKVLVSILGLETFSLRWKEEFHLV